jgi:hypothetical protein
MAFGRISVITDLICCSTINGEISNISATRFVFCAVIAVIAVHPYTPSAENIFKSACIPAPAPESLPAIDSAIFTSEW